MQCATPPTGRGSASPAPRGPDDAPPASAVPPARPAGAGAWTAWLEHAAPGGRWGGRAPDPSALATEPRGGGDMAPLEPRALVPPKPPGSGRPRAMRVAARPMPGRRRAGGRPGVGRCGRRLMATALLALGLVALLGGAATLLYAQWQEQQHLVQRPPGPHEDLPARWDDAAVGGTASDGANRGLRLAATKALGERATWMSIPRIGVDSSVMDVGLQGGEYQVPSFDVGHHADSANPGQPGNSVYNGHLETINAGHVFARLHELRPGDVVYVYTASYRFDWVVADTRIVRNDDRGFLQPTPEPRLTLYTCAGTFDLRTHDYTHRQVVVGRLAQVVPRSHPATAPS